jgi:hypothetical protein
MMRACSNMRPQQESPNQEVLAGLIERVTFNAVPLCRRKKSDGLSRELVRNPRRKLHSARITAKADL